MELFKISIITVLLKVLKETIENLIIKFVLPLFQFLLALHKNKCLHAISLHTPNPLEIYLR